jgi:acyl-CoA dehydrogenase
MRLKRFNAEHALSAERELMEHYHRASGMWPDRGEKWRRHPLTDRLISLARDAGLWNLWMPISLATRLKSEFPDWDWAAILPHGDGLSHAEYMAIAVESGHCLLTPLAINCSAPDTGNMVSIHLCLSCANIELYVQEIIALFGSREQKQRFLLPLLEGRVRSCFGMTEPDMSSSDPTQLQATATRSQSGGWTLNGRKWWTTGACDELCAVCIFVALTDSEEQAPHRRHSIFLVPFDVLGITVVRPLHVFGYGNLVLDVSQMDLTIA